MFSKHSQTSDSSSFTQDTGAGQSIPNSPSMLHKFGSNETLSVLSRTVTATSVNSSSTVNTTFESNWMPNSFVVSRKKYKVSLKLRNNEIELLRKSWAIVTSTDSRASESEGLNALASRNSSQTGLHLVKTNTNNSANNVPQPNNNNVSLNSNGSNFNTASFSSFLFCIQFYNNLIGMDPEIETLIPSIRHQATAFAGVVSVAIGTLEDLSKMKESLLNLGHLHARILGIDSPYFKIMGEALIKTFQDWFGNSPDSFPLELEEAWIKLYCFLANSIIQGGIDPIIEYNLQPNPNKRTTTTHTMDENSQIIEDEEPENDNEEIASSVLDIQSSFASNSIIDDKKSTISASTNNKGSIYSKFEPSTASSSTPPPQKTAGFATKNINRLKKGRNSNNKEDCTIM